MSFVYMDELQSGSCSGRNVSYFRKVGKLLDFMLDPYEYSFRLQKFDNFDRRRL